MTKTIYNARHARIEAKDGRKVLWSVPTGNLSEAVVQGILDALHPEIEDGHEDLISLITEAVAEAAKRKGSVIPDDYRVLYGADQNCGDAMAKALTAKTTTDAGVDLEACEAIASANGIADRFDQWVAKGLNNGMVRMNLGNVLRGKLRRGEEVTI